MNEPYVKTNIIDETSGITSITSTNGLQIGCPINALTGPTERVTLNSLSDLVRYFMPGNSFSSKDDITIQHIGALLGSSPVDVIRVDNSSIREGIGSIGSKVYFDSSYNLIEGYTNAKFESAAPTTPSTLWVQLSIQTQTITYYAGEVAGLPQDAPNPTLLYGDGSESTVDIDEFFQRFQTSLMKTSNNTYGIINNSPTEATFNAKVVAVGAQVNGGYFQATINQFSDQLWYAQLPADGGENLSSGTSIQVGESTLYLNTGVEVVSNLVNPVPIPEASLGVGATLPAAVWYGLVTDYIQNSPNIQNLTGLVANTTITVTGGSFALNGSINSRINVDTSAEPDANNDILAFPGDLETVKDYTIELIVGGTSYYFGDSLGLSKITSTRKTLIGANTLQGIFAELYMKLKGNSTFTSITSMSAATDTYMYYLEDIKPVTTFTLMSGVTQLNVGLGHSDGSSLTHLTAADNAKQWTFPSMWVVIDGNLFYTGNGSELPTDINTSTNMGSGSYSVDEFNNLLYRNLGVAFNTYGYTSNGFIIEGDYTAEGDILTSDNLTKSLRYVDQATYQDKFAVIAAFPATSKLFQYSYSNGEEEGQYELALSYKGESSEYLISFDPDAVDGYGNSLYYESVINSNGDINVFFRVAELSGTETQEAYTSPTFGNAITRLEPAPADYVIALNKFRDYNNKHYNYLWDAGYASPILVNAGVSLGKDIKAEFIPSFPVTYKKKSQFKQYRDNTAINNYSGYFLAPSQKQAALGNFNSNLAGSLTFLRAKIDLFNSGASEFAPAFGSNYGKVTIGSLYTTLGKADREELLDSQINTIMVGTSGPMINFNITAQKKHSYLDEEQFVYLTNVICHVADDYGESLIGFENNTSTRMKVEVELLERLTQRVIANKNPTVTAIRVVCNDDKLNTTAVVEARQIKYQVWVQYTPTTAYVLADTVIKRLGSF